MSKSLPLIFIALAAILAAAPALGQIAVCKPCDKDWNGECDPVIRRAAEDRPGAQDCGALTILYGTLAGVGVAGSEDIDQSTLGGNNGARDGFGAALAAGDFNGDNYGDTAIGVPGKDLGFADQGLVIVIYGGMSGLLPLNVPGPQSLAAIANPPQPGAKFGAALAAGDINGDGFEDLAIGIPFQDVGAGPDAGAVEVWYGSAAGLVAPERWTQDSPGVLDVAASGDRFGAALAIGDFNGDGPQDLAAGVPGEDLGPVGNAGALHVLFGTGAGLTAFGDQFLPSTACGQEENAQFGGVLSDGDFSGDGIQDLAVGVSNDDVGLLSNAGSVEILYGSAAGLGGAQCWNQDSPGMNGVAEGGDRFGYSLAAGDCDGDGDADLAVGIPSEDLGVAATDCGSVHVLYGTAGGLGAAGNLVIFSTACGIEAGAAFGADIASADYDGDLIDDLLIGIPFDDLASGVNSGSVEILYGQAGGSFAGAQCFNQETPGLASDGSEPNDRFGLRVEH